MGLAKATLPFGDELMLQRVVRLLGAEVAPIVVVAARGQELPPLPAEVSVVYDERPSEGPLEGLRVGLAALGDKADAAYATSCDVPLLVGGVVRRMIERLGDDAIAVPFDEQFHHPLAAVYRISVASAIERLLTAGRRRPVFLFDELPTRRVPVEELRDVDPRLDTLRNLNRPEDYFAALADAGLPVPAGVKEKLEE
jgi:molybdopterin-guanine dinucleotide biosynthesis protein A